MGSEEVNYGVFPVLVKHTTPTVAAKRVTTVIEEQRTRGWHMKSSFCRDEDVYLIMWKKTSKFAPGGI